MLMIRRRPIFHAAMAVMLSFAMLLPVVGQDAPPQKDGDAAGTDDGLSDLIRKQEEDAARARRWQPITTFGDPPPMVGIEVLTLRRQIEYRARQRRYAQEFESMRRRYFRSTRNESARAEGLTRLREFTDAAAFRPMIEEFAGADDDLRLAILDFFNEHGEQGQGALAWTAIYSNDAALRNEAQKRMIMPVSDAVKLEIEMALRSGENAVITHAGTLAGALNVVEAIPLLIYTQAGPPAGGGGGRGDLAWIAIQTQHAYVQELQPVTGDNTGAFAPILGIVSDGSILRVHDAVAIMYRTEVHYSLNGLVNRSYRGELPDELGYDPHAWTEWYNTVYVPHKNEQAEIEDLANQNDDRSDDSSRDG